MIAVCFLMVIFMSFFTGIIIGYIFFEFYAINKNFIQFNYMEGEEEVGNFLEDIRRSKDNGARMLNFNRKKFNFDNLDTDETLSMSALMRNQMNKCEETNANVESDNPFNTLTPPNVKTDTIEEQNVDAIEDVVEEVVENTIENILPEINNDANTGNDIKTEEDNISDNNISVEDAAIDVEFTEDNVPTGEFDEVEIDDEFMKKYYYDEDNISDESIVLENKEENNENIIDESIEENVTENIPVEEEISDDIMNDIFGDMSFGDDFYSTPIPEDAFGEDISIEEITVEENTNENEGVPDEKQDNTPVQTVSKKDDTQITSENIGQATPDKIESFVNISIGGSSKTEGLLNIPLVVTEKPVEPPVPPKRKRGRPPKKKKT